MQTDPYNLKATDSLLKWLKCRNEIRRGVDRFQLLLNQIPSSEISSTYAPPDGVRPLKPLRANVDNSHHCLRSKRPLGRPQVTKGQGKVPQQPSNELGGCLRRKLSPSTVPEPPLTDGMTVTTHDGRLD